jgi:formamidopyrimidine-DNA glycosylase
VPELPEVETIRRIVERELIGQIVSETIVRLPKLLRSSPIPTLEPLLGRMLLHARRRAKVLSLDFDDDLTLMMHLKLAGQVAVIRPDEVRFVAGHPVPDPTGAYPHKSTHIELHFESGAVLYVSDLRQFGWLRLMPRSDSEVEIVKMKFGPEAFGPEMVTVAHLKERLGRRSIPIKTALLDQSILAGLGNIYVDEALHGAKIHPLTAANAVRGAKLTALHAAIGQALEQGVAQGGAKIIHNKAYPIDGFPAVHGRAGESCPLCGATIKKTRVGARGTYYCPHCQPAKKVSRAGNQNQP